MHELVIDPEKEGKGRRFRAIALAWVEANHLWDGGASANDALRPIWATIVGSEEEIRPFVANLRKGRKARFIDNHGKGGQHFDLLKSAGYAWTAQRVSGGTAVMAYLPDLFLLDPGMVDPKRIVFCSMPGREWLAQQQIPAEEAVAHMLKLGYEKPKQYQPRHYEESAEEYLTKLVPRAAHWAACLDRRTRCPMPKDYRFYLQLLIAALQAGYTHQAVNTRRDRYTRTDGAPTYIGCDDLGYEIPLACKCTHEEFEVLVSEQVSLFFKTVG